MGDVHHHHRSGGIGLGGLLLVLFVALKLTGEIQWSWLWVLSPLWLPMGVLVGILALVAIAAAIAFVFAAISAAISDLRRARRRKAHAKKAA